MSEKIHTKIVKFSRYRRHFLFSLLTQKSENCDNNPSIMRSEVTKEEQVSVTFVSGFAPRREIMKNASKIFALGLLSASLLASCNPARMAADNTPVTALPIAGVSLAGKVSATAPAVGLQSITAQAVGYIKLESKLDFDDFDESKIPGIVGKPSGLDVPITFDKAVFKDCGVTAATLTGTLTTIYLGVKDSGGKAEFTMNNNIPFTLTRAADGSYTYTANKAMLNVVWGTFAPVVALKGTSTRNDGALQVVLSLNDVPVGCDTTFTTSADLQQYVRFQ